jgi:lantibiotic biosynthesis protein
MDASQRMASVGARRWVPLLEGSQLEQALEAICALADDLEKPELGPPVGFEAVLPASLAFGTAGRSLFYSYLAVSPFCPDREGAEEMAADLLDASVYALEDKRMTADLSGGVAGIGWVYEHTASLTSQVDHDDPCAEIDEVLRNWCDAPVLNPDVIQGVAGICLYAAERPRNESSAALIDHTVRRLESLSTVEGEGRAWRVPKWIGALLSRYEKLGTPEEMEEKIRSGVFKVGAAHGVSGILACLGAVADRADQCLVRTLARDAFEWMWRQRLPEDGVFAFPDFVGVQAKYLTTGWCNGDIGTAMALFSAARGFQWPDMEARALAVARQVARLRADDVEVFNRRNAMLCHGSAGRAHIFNRLYQETDEALFAETAVYWYEQALSIRVDGEGIGGFLAHEPGNGGSKTVRGFLMGAAGLGLALLAAVTDVEPGWDRLLLASRRSTALQAAS